jgi:hypothetical protein
MTSTQSDIFDNQMEEPDSHASPNFLIPFSVSGAARSLAICLVIGRGRGDDGDDLQGRLSPRLIGFKDLVPLWALEASKGDGAYALVMACTVPEKLFKRKKKGQYFDRVGPLPTSVVQFLAFESIETQQDFLRRVKMFPDVPLNLFETRVAPDLFGKDQIGKEVMPKNMSASVRDSTLEPEMRPYNKSGGILALLRENLIAESGEDGAYQLAAGTLAGLNKQRELAISIYGAARADACADSLDEELWIAVIHELNDYDAGTGIDAFRFLDDVVDRVRKAEGLSDAENDLGKWESRCRKILEGDEDFPQFKKDDPNENKVARWAILLFLVSKERQFLIERLARDCFSPQVAGLARSLCGLFEGVARLPSELKGDTREQLDCLSQLIVDVSVGKVAPLEITDPDFSEGYSLVDRVRYRGAVLAARSYRPPQELAELFARALRVSWHPRKDRDEDLFYFVRDASDVEVAKEDRIYISVDRDADASHITFYHPVCPITTKKPTKAQFERLFSLATKHSVAFGSRKIFGSTWLVLSWMQILDTFDHEELSSLDRRLMAAKTSLSALKI